MRQKVISGQGNNGCDVNVANVDVELEGLRGLRPLKDEPVEKAPVNDSDEHLEDPDNGEDEDSGLFERAGSFCALVSGGEGKEKREDCEDDALHGEEAEVAKVVVQSEAVDHVVDQRH